ncbi:hypothetical protein HK102_013819 [Quaeritorhiza haematococci]|nr:hypothetical protein HK102_013819 [Quaeritorhiza haematococci]
MPNTLFNLSVLLLAASATTTLAADSEPEDLQLPPIDPPQITFDANAAFDLLTQENANARVAGDDTTTTNVPQTSEVNALETPDDLPLDGAFPGIGYELKTTARQPSEDIDVGENTDNVAGGSRSGIAALEAYFGQRFEINAGRLPNVGAIRRPWAGDYWPTYRDGINYRWEGPGTLSPVEKYARAFNIDPQALADGLSWTSGVDSMRGSRPGCRQTSDCARLNDGSECAIRNGQSVGLCIPTWFGICHAWAPAALLEPEPRCPINVNGVTFRVADIKALMTQMYDKSGIRTVFGGNRCNDVTPTRDAYGRYKSFACRDVTPDYWHILMTNAMGRFNTSFVADVTASAEVWNHPMTAMRIERLQQINLQQGAQLIDPSLTSYPFNPNARSLAYVVMRIWYTVETEQDGPLVETGLVDQYFTRYKDLTYLLELDGSNNIIGGEWLGKSKQDHPDFIYLPYTRPNNDFTVAGAIQYKIVKQMLNMSINKQC